MKSIQMSPEAVMEYDGENAHIAEESDREEAAKLGISVEELRARFLQQEQDDSWLEEATVF